MKTYTVKQWLDRTYSENDYNVRPKALCKDGFSISIQGGNTHHYCLPRTFGKVYQQLELGYPSEPLPELKFYSEEKTYDGVFGYVPIEKVEKLIKKHGGIIGDQELGQWYFIFNK